MGLTLEEIIERIARGHAFHKHVEGNDPGSNLNGRNSFTQSALIAEDGTRITVPNLNIHTPEDLQSYMTGLIDDAQTRGFQSPETGAIHLFNEVDGTYMIVNPFDSGIDSLGDGDFGSVYRYAGSAQSFEEALDDARDASTYNSRHHRATFTEFDNASTPSAARAQIVALADDINANPQAWRSQSGVDHVRARALDPGQAVQQIHPSSGNMVTGLSDGYRTQQTLAEGMGALRSGDGYVSALNSEGRPHQMFLIDRETSVVTEINGRDISVHSFDDIPDIDRATAADSFFNAHLPQGVTPTNGGYDELVTGFMRQNPGSIPLSGPSLGTMQLQMSNGLINGDVVDYPSANAMVARISGLAEDQIQLFNAIPSELSDDVIELIAEADIPEETFMDLVQHKSDVLSGERTIQSFGEALEGIDPAARQVIAGQTDALQTLRSAEAARTMTGAFNAAQDGSTILGGLRDSIQLLRASRIAATATKATVVTTVAATAISVGSTAYANELLLDGAEQLYEAGELDAEQYQDYQDMMGDIGPILTGQAADPTPLAIPGMILVDRIAHNRYEDFTEKHYDLPDNVLQTLSPATIGPETVRGEFGDNVYDYLPLSTEGSPEVLHDLIEARAEIERVGLTVDEALAAAPVNPFSVPFLDDPPALQRFEDPTVQARMEELETAIEDFQTAFDETLSTPEGAQAVVGLLEDDQLFDIVQATAQHNPDDHAPLIEEYVQAQGLESGTLDLVGAWNNSAARDDAEQALMDNPEVMRDYVTGIFVRDEQTPEADMAPVANDALDVVIPAAEDEFDVDSDPVYIEVANSLESVRAGEELDTSEVERVQGVLADEEELYAPEVAETLEERYPEEIEAIAEDTPDLEPVETTIPAPYVGQDNTAVAPRL